MVRSARPCDLVAAQAGCVVGFEGAAAVSREMSGLAFGSFRMALGIPQGRCGS